MNALWELHGKVFPAIPLAMTHTITQVRPWSTTLRNSPHGSPPPLRKWNPRFDRRNGCSNNVAKTGIHESLWLVETFFAQKYNNLATNCNKQSDHGSTLLPGSSLYLERGPWERGCSRLSVGSTASVRDFLFDSRVSLIRCFPLETEPRVFRLLHHTT